MSLNISPIQPIPIPQIEGLTNAAPSGSGEFQNILASAIGEVQGASNGANQSVESFLKGEGDDLHSTILTVQRAGLEFDMLMQTRNKVVSAYQEIMRMQL
jgi:flagellar hook-basal body complex protein FliE